MVPLGPNDRSYNILTFSRCPAYSLALAHIKREFFSPDFSFLLCQKEKRPVGTPSLNTNHVGTKNTYRPGNNEVPKQDNAFVPLYVMGPTAQVVLEMLVRDSSDCTDRHEGSLPPGGHTTIA